MRAERCPHCEVDLRNPEYPRYSRKIGVEIPEIYDGVLYWLCPDCDATWNRWDEQASTVLWAQAEKHMVSVPK